jgi:peptidoglycan/LPS O-acetylase OafA/YrhL
MPLCNSRWKAMHALSANNFTEFRITLASMVVVDHYHTLPGADRALWFGFGSLAVNAFFVVSGYLVWSSYARRTTIGPFYIRRFFRIYPLLAVMVLCQAVVMLALPGRVLVGDTVRYIAANLTFATFLFNDIGGITHGLPVEGIDPSLWTLKIEAAFYAIVPLIWIAWLRWGWLGLACLLAASTVFYQLLYFGPHEKLGQQLPGQLRYFICGIAIYELRGRLDAVKPFVALAAGLVAFLVCFALRAEEWFAPAYPVLLGLGVGLLALRTPPLPVKSDLSYGVYLIHGPLIQVALLLGIFHAAIASAFAVTAATFVLAYISEKLIELPGIATGQRFARRWESLPGNAQQTLG